mmetsp:Transcript_2828/g.8511  ORF Transcript_2828/g.8511 Transcript_2828/m.8511 type:complete len:329 (+) Transcript_2828:1397-2383(+)
MARLGVRPRSGRRRRGVRPHRLRRRNLPGAPQEPRRTGRLRDRHRPRSRTRQAPERRDHRDESDGRGVGEARAGPVRRDLRRDARARRLREPVPRGPAVLQPRPVARASQVRRCLAFGLAPRHRDRPARRHDPSARHRLAGAAPRPGNALPASAEPDAHVLRPRRRSRLLRRRPEQHAHHLRPRRTRLRHPARAHGLDARLGHDSRRRAAKVPHRPRRLLAFSDGLRQGRQGRPVRDRRPRLPGPAPPARPLARPAPPLPLPRPPRRPPRTPPHHPHRRPPRRPRARWSRPRTLRRRPLRGPLRRPRWWWRRRRWFLFFSFLVVSNLY